VIQMHFDNGVRPAAGRRNPTMHSNTYALETSWRPILKDLGVSAARVLRRAGMPEDLLVQGSARLGAADFYRFWNALAEELDDPLFPLRLCQAVRSESFSPPLFAALCSPNFLVAVERIARFKALVAPMRLELKPETHTVTLGIHWPDPLLPPPQSLVVTELLFFVSLLRMGTREPLKPLRVETTHPPAEAEEFEQFLGVRIRRGKTHRVVFDAEDAQRPFLTANEGMWATFEPELRTRLMQLDTSVTMEQRVRAVLLEALPSGLAAMDAVAKRLFVSRRTLQRQLEAEGTTYMRLLQETRSALALHYLRKTTLPAAEISFLLGFEEPNSFYRAFRDWTGRTPEEVRHRGSA